MCCKFASSFNCYCYVELVYCYADLVYCYIDLAYCYVDLGSWVPGTSLFLLYYLSLSV